MSNNLPASIAGGECRIFRAPDYAIRGKTQIDQDYIDDNTEAGIAACKWSRPKARPAPAVVQHKTVIIKGKPKLIPVASPPVKSTVPAPPPVKKHWWQRIAPAHRT